MSTETQMLKADIAEYFRITSRQAAEIEALKADIATYVRAASEQATEIEALRNELKTASAHLHRARRNARTDVEEMAYTQALKGIDALLDAAKPTKEAS